MPPERPGVNIRIQFWGKEGAHADRLVRTHSEQAFGSLGPMQFARRGGAHCLAPIYEIFIDDGEDMELVGRRHAFFLDALRHARRTSQLPPLRVDVQHPPLGATDL